MKDPTILLPNKDMLEPRCDTLRNNGKSPGFNESKVDMDKSNQAAPDANKSKPKYPKDLKNMELPY